MTKILLLSFVFCMSGVVIACDHKHSHTALTHAIKDNGSVSSDSGYIGHVTFNHDSALQSLAASIHFYGCPFSLHHERIGAKESEKLTFKQLMKERVPATGDIPEDRKEIAEKDVPEGIRASLMTIHNKVFSLVDAAQDGSYEDCFHSFFIDQNDEIVVGSRLSGKTKGQNIWQ